MDDISKKLKLNATKTGHLVIRLDNIIQKRLGQKQLFRMVAISIGKHSGIKRKDVLIECKNNKDRYIEVKHEGYYDESNEFVYYTIQDCINKVEDYKRQILKTNFLKSIKNAIVFMSAKDKEKAQEIEKNKSWESVEDMLLLSGLSISFTYYDKKGNEIK